ncbi:MAG: GTP-binding protein [Candidatus Shikimatogenerans sp. AspAUS03]|uniref:GTP-binding protein n=1 Tax=Candidatus Shikimatogenerans sp. AspAUS03 TaxID=3158563 RepID=A0AAU7QT25_9FLAO
MKKIKYNYKNLIIAIMGHVDHGKTSFIDNLKKTNIAKKEIGQITQKNYIIDYTYKNKKIIFIDTPGHKDFIKLKLQSLKILDLILFFISCEINKISKQIEKILNYIYKYKNIKIIFIISKIDLNINKKYSNNILYIKNYLLKKKFLLKEYGGKYYCFNISIKNNNSIINLLNHITKLNIYKKYIYNTKAKGYILNSFFNKKIGYYQLIILKQGHIKIGNYIKCNNKFGKIKNIIHNNVSIKKIDINIPVKIIGLKGAFNFGNKFTIYNKKIKLKSKKENKLYLENNIKNDIFKKKKKTINIILKADLLSSIDAIINIINKINKEYKNIIKVIYKNIGDITLNDINLAKNTKSIIINFNIKYFINKNLNNIIIKNFNIIYQIYDYLIKKIKKKKKYIIKGILTIKKFYKIKNQIICGCKILKGQIKKQYKIKLIRNKKNIFTNHKIESLKFHSKNINLLKKGKYCGLIVKDYDKFYLSDILIVYK